MSRATFVYRGQLTVELSRLQFLLAATCAAFDEVDVVMLSPGLGASPDDLASFTAAFPNVRSSTFLDARRRSPGARAAALIPALRPDAPAIVAVGFSVVPYLPGRQCLAWCVNGIPEERLFHHDTSLQRLAVRWSWAQARRCRRVVTVAVSRPMADLLEARTGSRSLVVPNAVDRAIFRPDGRAEPRFLTYAGGGSPWQGLPYLASVWRALWALEPSLRFRVVSRDDRARVLADGLPPDAVDVVAADEPAEVAMHLREARLGFLLRRRHLANDVACPMKLGEYLASGAPVATTSCGWDVEDLVRRHGAGVVVDPASPPDVVAAEVLGYLRSIGPSRPPGVQAAASELDRERWLARLAASLADASR